VRAANRLIAQVPRLEPVSRLLDVALGVEAGETADDTERSLVSLLQLAIELDSLESRDIGIDAALKAMRERNAYAEQLLDAAERVVARSHEAVLRSTVLITGLRVGMVLDEDLETQRGVLVAPRGCEVTPSFLQHISQFVEQIQRESVTVLETPACG